MADNELMLRDAVVAFLRHVSSRHARWKMSDIWPHGHGDWSYSEDARCWLVGPPSVVPRAICLGERYAHADYGLDSYGILWSGSTSGSWHECSFKDMGAALEFVRAARYSGFGPILWSGLDPESAELAEKYGG